MARHSPGLEAREKLTRVKAEAKMALPNLHDAMMSPEAGQVKPGLVGLPIQSSPSARRLQWPLPPMMI